MDVDSDSKSVSSGNIVSAHSRVSSNVMDSIPFQESDSESSECTVLSYDSWIRFVLGRVVHWIHFDLPLNIFLCSPMHVVIVVIPLPYPPHVHVF